ncbi:hypothetical protein LguiB_010043 [Lonicera macranthoides]
MDREQEDLQFLGLFGIYKESFKIIFSWRKIFSQITLALIIPLSFIFLAHSEISHLLFRKILRTESELYESHPGTSRYQRLSDLMSKEWAYYWLFKLILFGLVFQTIIYFVCKSYHHENIDKSALSNHLEDIYLGEYLLLKPKDVQLEQYQA